MAANSSNQKQPITNISLESVVQHLWNYVISKSTSCKDLNLIPIEILISFVDRSIYELGQVIDNCLITEEEFRSFNIDENDSKKIRISPVLCNVLNLSSSYTRTKPYEDITDDFRMFIFSDNQTNQNNDLLEKSSDELENRKLDFFIRNDKLMCMLSNHCQNMEGFSSFLSLKKHFVQFHLRGQKDPALDQIPNIGLRSVDQLKLEPDFFQDEEELKIDCESEKQSFVDETKVSDFSSENDENESLNKKIPCTHCTKRFSNGQALQRHINKFHNLSNSEKVCLEKNLNSNPCQSSKDVPIEKRTCIFCSLVFETKSMLSKHEKTHSGPFKCKECSTILANKDIYKQHMKDLHTKSTDSICEECGMSFKNRRYLWGHIKNHHSGKFILCTDCGKNFKPSAYRDHRKYKHSAIPLTRIHCEDCGNTFRSKLTLKTHQAIVHGKGNRTILQCDKCPRKCTSESQMKKHIMSAHLGIKQHVCSECSKEFCHKDSLKKHQALAHGLGDQKVFICEQCSKKFVSEARMKDHIQVMHLGIKHQCPNCSKEFSRKSSMNKHLRNGRCSIISTANNQSSFNTQTH